MKGTMKLEMSIINQLIFKNCLMSSNKLKKIIEPYRANVSEIFDIDTLKKVLLGHHAAYFSCANLQLNLKTMQYWSGELQSALTTLLKKVFTSNLPSKI